jgi:hypothetical protein
MRMRRLGAMRPAFSRWWQRCAAGVIVVVLACLSQARAQSEGPNLRDEYRAWRQAQSASPDRDDLRDDRRLWSVTGFFGASAGDDRFTELLSSPWNAQFRSDYFMGVAGSRRLARFWTYFTIEGELGAGYRAGESDSPELWAALYLRYDGFPWNEYVFTTVGVSTGLDWVAHFSPEEASASSTSHVLHYFSPEITLALPSHLEHELVFRYHHRSGVFGTFNGVYNGSTVFALGYRYRF